MKFTQDYLLNARGVIVNTVKGERAELLGKFGACDFENKSDGTVVTALDKKLEDLLRTNLQSLDSSVQITGEEGGAEGSDKTRWILDPIDGTAQFIRGLPGCVTMASLVEDDKPVMVVLYDFINDTIYTAIKGKGAECDGTPISVSTRPIDDAWLELSNFSDFVANGAVEKLSKYLTVTRFRNAVINVATGKVEGYAVLNGKGGPWDYIPRSFLIEEAGGRVANIGSETYDYHNQSFIATAPQIFDIVMECLT